MANDARATPQRENLWPKALLISATIGLLIVTSITIGWRWRHARFKAAVEVSMARYGLQLGREVERARGWPAALCRNGLQSVTAPLEAEAFVVDADSVGYYLVPWRGNSVRGDSLMVQRFFFTFGPRHEQVTMSFPRPSDDSPPFPSYTAGRWNRVDRARALAWLDARAVPDDSSAAARQPPQYSGGGSG